jgi:phosphoglycolate phosphatase
MTLIATDLGPLPRPRAVLFDWDNTLVDSWPIIHQALHDMFTAMGHAPWTLDECKARVRLSLRDSFPALFGTRWEEARQIYMEAFQAIHLERLTALAGVVELLDHLNAAGCYLAVVSNKTGPVLRREAAHLGWSRYFTRLVGATDAVADKPDPAPIHLALEGSGIVAGPEVWYVGDTAVDIECALNAGCVPVLLGPAKPDDAEFSLHRPRVAFDDCSGLFLHIRTL